MYDWNTGLIKALLWVCVVWLAVVILITLAVS